MVPERYTLTVEAGDVILVKPAYGKVITEAQMAAAGTYTVSIWPDDRWEIRPVSGSA